MVGENIQKFREQLQSVRGNFTMGQGFLGKLTSLSSGALSNIPMGKRISERVQSMRGTGKSGTTVSTVGQYGVHQETPATPSRKFISV